jgi:hypothetical protein
MGKCYEASHPDTTRLGIVLAEWLRRLAGDHDGAALLVAKTVGSLMFEDDGPDGWFRLSRICDLTGQSPAVVAGILRRLRRRGRLDFERRDGSPGGRHDGDHHGRQHAGRYDDSDPQYRFTIPTEMPEQIERTPVWATTGVRKR